jgi:hypothetical protein|tara:strand:- start:5688 stop:5963 length:276 start_codon:yes stop_codon:yes gene_type:complete
VQQYIEKSRIETPEDIEYQLQGLAYRVAKHYGISLLEVYSMSPALFRQSLAWALVVEEEQQEQAKVQKQKAKSKGNETVRLDYTFLDKEDF